MMGERFVLLSDDGVYRAPLPATEINKTAYYKGIPDGGNWDDAPSNPFVFKGNSLRCFAPDRSPVLGREMTYRCALTDAAP